MLLHELHQSLSSHFSALSGQRKEIDFPVFALEHNLSPHELEELSEVIHRHLGTSAPDERHWLPWIVYATEIGYEFDGHEYWQTFSEKTPNWKNREDRSFIRNCFKLFTQSYSGFRPSGTWADHFNIIAYPVTHAILPRDLQHQFSRVLYQLRTYISPALIQSPRLLGKKISDNSYDESKRFQQFSQNFDLVGLIAREILTVDESGSENVISSSTFRRIVNDLRKQDEAAYFVDETRSVLKERSQTRARKGIQLSPRLLFRRTAPDNWDLTVEIPDLQPVSSLSDEAEQFLTAAKPRILGSSEGSRLARGRLVGFGPILQSLESLPGNETAIVNFRREFPQTLEEVFRKQLVFRLPRTVLFKVQSSGIASQTNSRNVDPANQYLILSRQPLTGNPLVHQLKCPCGNVFVYSLRSELLPKYENSDALLELDLRIDNRLELVPVTPQPLKWDGGSSLEYLDGEAPCFAVRLNTAWTTFRIQIDDFDVLEVKPTSESEFEFFSLPALSTGLYKLSYSFKSNPDSDYQDLGGLSIYVKDRIVWRPGTSSQNALIVLTDPPKPSFERFFSGDIDFDILCPDSSVAVVFRLLGKRADNSPIFSRNVTVATLPAELKKINESIGELVSDQKIVDLSESAHLCQLEFASDELGSVNLDFRREFNPLNWELRYDRDGHATLNLSDDGDERIEVYRYPFERPDSADKLIYEEHFPDCRVSIGGGLFVAVTERQKKGVIILREDKIKSFKSFSDIGKGDELQPVYKSHARTIEGLKGLIELYSLWAKSRSLGGVFTKRDVRRVLEGFLSRMVWLIDDYEWKVIERKYLEDPTNHARKGALISGVSPKSTIRSGLRDEHFLVDDQSPDRLVDALADIYKSEITPAKIVKPRSSMMIKAVIKTIDPKWFVEFALRLCSQPERLEQWCQTEERFSIGLRKMLDNPSLVRAARFLTLVRQSDRSAKKWDWE